MSYLLDTNVISELRKGERADSNVTAWFAELADEEIILSVLTIGEIRRGIENVRRRDPDATARSSACGSSTPWSGRTSTLGAVLVHGARAPYVIKRQQLALMKPGAVLVDVAIDQGGCFETSRPTTHGDPTFEVDGITHYCVANMPGAVPITSTHALTNATLPYLVRLAAEGVEGALGRDPGFAAGLNVAAGQLTNEAVAVDQGRELTTIAEGLAAVAAGARVPSIP